MSTEQLTPRVTAAGAGIGRASGFELTGPGHPDAANVEGALERNRAFAAAGGHQGAVVFPNLSLFVLRCLDPHTDPAHFLCLGLSDAMVVRNVGGRVTPEVINDVAFIGQLTENALSDGPLLEVAVIHHTQCGTGALAISRASPSPGTSTTSSPACWRRPSPLTAHQLEPLNKPNRLK